MGTILWKATGFILVILCGYTMKRRGLVTKEDAKLFSKLVMNVTLPCALLVSTSSLQLTGHLWIPFVLGILANVILDLLGYWESKQAGQLASAGLVQLSGYNIGTFTMPFVQAFFPVSSLMTVLLFDAGNAIMVLGGNYSLATILDREQAQLGLGRMLANLLSSIPLLVYLLTLLLASLHITLPEGLLAMASIGANANPFLAMFMLGILLELDLDQKEVGRLLLLISLRLGINSCLGMLLYFLLPLTHDMKMMLLVCLVSPISVVAPIYAMKLGSRSAEAANVNSLSILTSLGIMVALLLFLT